MKLNKRVHRTVTQGDWGVSCTTGTGIKGAILKVYRARVGGVELHDVRKWPRGFGDGRRFESTDAAYQFAFDHGYLQLYFTPTELRQRNKERASNPFAQRAAA